MIGVLDARDVRVSQRTNQVFYRIVVSDPADGVTLDISERPQFAIGDLKWQTTLICLHCGRGKEMIDATIKDIAVYCHDHARKTCRQRVFSESPSVYKSCIRRFCELEKGDKTPDRLCPVIWDVDVIQDWFSDAAKAALVSKEIPICVNCLQHSLPKKNHCCDHMLTRMVLTKRVDSSHATLIMDNPEVPFHASLRAAEAKSKGGVVVAAVASASSPTVPVPSVSIPVTPKIMTTLSTHGQTLDQMTPEQRSAYFETVLRDGALNHPRIVPLSDDKVLHLGESGTCTVVDMRETALYTKYFQQALEAHRASKAEAAAGASKSIVLVQEVIDLVSKEKKSTPVASKTDYTNAQVGQRTSSSLHLLSSTSSEDAESSTDALQSTVPSRAALITPAKRSRIVPEVIAEQWSVGGSSLSTEGESAIGTLDPEEARRIEACLETSY